MLRTDLKIFKSERMTQQPDAGGQRTGNEVLNGKLNEVFGNISDIDHAQSAVDIVKVYPAVATNNTELLQDGHILINEPPLDPLVDVMIIESAAINDGSERADIVEAIESSLVASLLLRSGLSEMLPGQDQLSTLDFTSSVLAGPGEQPRVTLSVGGIYCLAVEYTGNESVEWPRYQHFIKILESTSQYIRFAPSLPYPAPGRGRVINGQANCTKLRDTTAGTGVIYHGVTQLTALAAGTTLAVERTAGRVTPLVTEAVVRENNVPFPSENGLLKNVVQVPAVGLAYTVPISDLATFSDFDIGYVNQGTEQKQTVYGSALSGGQLSFVLNRIPDTGTQLSISYYSSDRYISYDSADPFPAGYTLKTLTMIGSALRVGNGDRYTLIVYENEPNVLYIQTQPGITWQQQVAIINPSDGTATYYNGYGDLQYTAVLEEDSASGESALAASFVMPFSGVLPYTFYVSVELVSGGLLTASADTNGDISGTNVTGTLNGSSVVLTFAQAVKLSTLRYNVNELVQLIPPQSLYGINQLRLPNGGAVDLFRVFGVICIAHNEYEQYPSLTAAQTISRRPNSFIDIVDADGESLWHPLQQHYEYDKETGEVTIVDVTGFTAPFELIDTLSELALVTGVEAKQLKISKPLVGSYPAGSVVSSVAKLGDLQARVTNIFDQEIWNGTFTGVIQGAPAAATYNNIDYPIQVANDGAINQLWAIQFLSNQAFRCVGETVGQIATGDILNDFAPINPATGKPYFVIPAAGWGDGWLPGNTVFPETVAASPPIVLVRSVASGHSAIDQDSIRLHFRGNAQ